MFNNKKSIIIICITIITILEAYLAYQVVNKYVGLYQIQVSIALIFQPMNYYNLLFKKHKNYVKLRITVLILISLILPIIIYFTLPSYTYIEGKILVEQYEKSGQNLEFIDVPKDEDTIPIVDNPTRLFVSNRAYYYVTKIDAENKYFIVNPISGKVHQISDSYWPEFNIN